MSAEREPDAREPDAREPDARERDTREIGGLARWLLETCLPADTADAVVGDLTERQAARPGRLRLWREVFAALVMLGATPRPGDGLVSDFVNDLRLAARLLRRSPGFALVAVLTLGLGLGAATAIVSVVTPVLLEPLPYPRPDDLAFVWERGRDGSRDNVGFATYRDLVAQSRGIERAAAIGSWEPTLSDHGEPERVSGDRVSHTYFRTLGVQPALGRDFLAEEDQPDHNQVVILSHGLWTRRYGADPSLVGQTISIGDRPMTVVGIMPASFENVVSPGAQIWRVLGYAETQPWACRTCHHLRMVVRLRPGGTAAGLSAELDAIHGRLAATYPGQYASTGTSIVPVKEFVTLEYRGALLALAGAVALLLLIAIANVTNLQLARAVRRREEFAIRAALGAGHGRLVRQLLTEGLLLAVLGGLAGLAVAAAGIPALVAQLPPGMPRLDAVALDGTALAVLGAVVLAFAVIVGVAPARMRATGLGDALRSGRRLAGVSHHAARSTLVVAEMALALVLLASAGLVGRSLVRLLAVDPGFDPSHLLTLEINAIGAAYGEDAQVLAYHERVREAVRALPGVTSVAVANQLPLAGNVDTYGVRAQDRPLANPELAPSGDRYVVSDEYFAALRVPLVRGRHWKRAEALDSAQRVALVSEALAARVWGADEALGKRVQMGGTDAPWHTVIGVTRDVRHRGLDVEVAGQWYVPQRQWRFADNQAMLVVRTTGDPAAMTGVVRAAIRAIDPSQPIVKVASMERVIASSTTQRRVAFALFGAFALVAVLLAVAGIYGVLAGLVAERTREIGVRSALGASPRDILTLILGHGARLAALGLAVGLAGALAGTRLLRTLLYRVEPNDAPTLIGVVAVLAGIALLACLVPALRALRVDPSTALRAE